MALNLANLGALAAKIGMTIAGSVRVEIELHAGKAGAEMEIDPATDTATADPAGQTIAQDVRGGALKALKWQEKRQRSPMLQMQDGDSEAYSHTIGIEAAALPPGLRISVMDWIQSGGARWELMSADLDPAGALWILRVRK